MQSDDLHLRMIESIGLIFETMDWNEVLGRVVRAVHLCFEADTASLLLPHPEGGYVVAFSEVATREGANATGRREVDSVATRVAASKQPVVIVGALAGYPMFAGLPSRRAGGSSLVCPILLGAEVLGVLTANRSERRPAFVEGDLKTLGTVASFVRMAIGNARLYQQVQTTSEELRRQIAERQRMEAELRLAQKLESVGQLAAGIAHEINTPIQYIGDSVSFVRDAVAAMGRVIEHYRKALQAAGDAGQIAALKAAEQQEDLDYLEGECVSAVARSLAGVQQVSNIVRAMKQFAHTDRAGRMEPADVNRALETTLTVAQHEYRSVADVETVFGDLPPVLCNVGDLNQVFLNLVVNAAHAIADLKEAPERRGRIGVATRIEGGEVVVAVSDTGCGIPEAIRDRVFDPFFTTKQIGRGSGQGLSIARAIVDRHGGSLTFESTVGRGTTFVVRLPIGAHATK